MATRAALAWHMPCSHGNACRARMATRAKHFSQLHVATGTSFQEARCERPMACDLSDLLAGHAPSFSVCASPTVAHLGLGKYIESVNAPVGLRLCAQTKGSRARQAVWTGVFSGWVGGSFRIRVRLRFGTQAGSSGAQQAARCVGHGGQGGAGQEWQTGCFKG
eukprot:188171-Chlamydomonas_euryale.AAC.2